MKAKLSFSWLYQLFKYKTDLTMFIWLGTVSGKLVSGQNIMDFWLIWHGYQIAQEIRNQCCRPAVFFSNTLYPSYFRHTCTGTTVHGNNQVIVAKILGLVDIFQLSTYVTNISVPRVNLDLILYLDLFAKYQMISDPHGPIFMQQNLTLCCYSEQKSIQILLE